MQIIDGDLDDPRIVAMLRLHVERARAESARGSAHALDLEALRASDVRVWAAWEGEAVLGVGALRRIGPDHGEIKSMYTAETARGVGVASAMLRHIIASAREAGLARLNLETGSWAYFAPARALYRRHAFVECLAFGDYAEDPNSVFMTLDLAEQAGPIPGS